MRRPGIASWVWLSTALCLWGKCIVRFSETHEQLSHPWKQNPPDCKPAASVAAAVVCHCSLLQKQGHCTASVLMYNSLWLPSLRNCPQAKTSRTSRNPKTKNRPFLSLSLCLSLSLSLVPQPHTPFVDVFSRPTMQPQNSPRYPKSLLFSNALSTWNLQSLSKQQSHKCSTVLPLL
jgi:hypothetical protein